MATFELRPIEPDEIPAYMECLGAAFGGRLTARQLEVFTREIPLERSVAVFDGVEIVGTAASHDLRMTLPGPVRARAAAVAEVTVAPTHRRRGLLTAMMRRQLDDLHVAGEYLAVLFASEGAIYGRYGYGVATFGARYVMDKRAARFLPRATAGTGAVRLLDRHQALEAFPAVFEAYLPTRSGEVDRLVGVWSELIPDPDDPLGDARERFYVGYEEHGRVDGYAVYRVASTGALEPGEERAVFLEELCALSDGAYGSLWRYLAGIDLAFQVRTRSRPTDDVLPLLLEDPRAARVTAVGDRTWLRIIDVERAFAARRYAEAGTLVVAVADEFCPWNDGRYRVEADSDGVARAQRVTDLPAELTVDVGALAAAYLGGTRLTGLAAAGRVLEHVGGALKRADAMFGNDGAPYCTTTF